MTGPAAGIFPLLALADVCLEQAWIPPAIKNAKSTAKSWINRLAPLVMPGEFMCGACAHPGGSVMGINGLNAAIEIINSLH